MRKPPALLALFCFALVLRANATPPCKASQLSLSRDSDSAEGALVEHIAILNFSLRPCTVKGHPKLVAVDDKDTLGGTVKFQRSNPAVDKNLQLRLPSIMTLGTGDIAEFEISYADGTAMPSDDLSKYCNMADLYLKLDDEEQMKIGKAGICSAVSVTSFRKQGAAKVEETNPAQRVAPCLTSQLEVGRDDGVAGGHVRSTILLTNSSKTPCVLSGYPRVAPLDKSGRRIKRMGFAPSEWTGDENASRTPPKPVVIRGGETAVFDLYYIDGIGYDEKSLFDKS